jgi:hypothetical protein
MRRLICDVIPVAAIKKTFSDHPEPTKNKIFTPTGFAKANMPKGDQLGSSWPAPVAFAVVQE